MNEITEEKLKAKAKRLIDEAVINMPAVNDMIASNIHIGTDLYTEFIANTLLAIAKKDIERAWEND